MMEFTEWTNVFDIWELADYLSLAEACRSKGLAGKLDCEGRRCCESVFLDLETVAEHLGDQGGHLLVARHLEET